MTTRINGTAGNDTLMGTSGSDVISGDNGNDVLNGGVGSDLLYGGQGNDTYHWDPVSGGRDQIGDIGGNDTLRINALASELTFSLQNNGQDLRIQFGHVSHLDITQHFGSSPIETFVFADGTTWTREQVLAALTAPLVPSENIGPEILRMDGGRVTEGSQSLDPVVGWIRAHDENGDALTYTLLDDAGGRFRLDGHTIRVDDWNLIDYETSRFHEIRVLVTDTSGATAEEVFKIEVLDRLIEPTPPPPPPPNRAPEISWIAAEDVPETATGGYVVGTIHGYDPDGDPLTYSTPAGYDGPFKIVGNKVVVREGAVLVGGTLSYMPITVSDGRGGTVTKVYDFRIKDLPEDPLPNRAPSELILDGNEVAENADGLTPVGALSAFDPEGDSYYYILENDAGGLFELRDNIIVVKDGARLDYETAKSHEIAVRVIDEHGASLSKNFTIFVKDVNETPHEEPIPGNQPPSGAMLETPVVYENVPTGTIVGKLRGLDPDPGETFTYTLLDGAEDRFKIEGNQVVVADGSKIDFETAELHEIQVRVTDSHGAFLDVTLRVHVRDVFEVPVPPPNRAPTALDLHGSSVFENAPNATVIGRLSAWDPDGDPVSYQLVDDAEGRFIIHGNLLVVKDGAKLDYETLPSHDIKVRVVDIHGAAYEKSFTIDVKDVDDGIPGDDPEEDPGDDLSGLVLVGGTGNDRIIGGGLDDTIIGGRGHDTILGGAGDDFITGGQGKDVLTGGSGEDTFIFNAAISAANADRITDFSTKHDVIHLARSIFKTAGSKGQLAKKAFWEGKKAHDANDRIIYDDKSGNLFYDADGTGAKAATKIATLKAGLDLSYEHFLVI